MDLTPAAAPRSDQLNADDLIAGPITVTIENVRPGSSEQPVNIDLIERPGRAYRPSKSMVRVLIAAWGNDSTAYHGRRLTLYRNPDIKFGGQTVGGIEISHMSHLELRLSIPLTRTRGKKTLHTVETLTEAQPAAYTIPNLDSLDEYKAHYARRQAEGASPQELAEIRSVAETRAAQGGES